MIFTTKDLVPILQKYRQNLPTYYIVYNITDFHTYQFKDRISTHPIHCPSVELNLIWNEKIHMVKKAAEINIFNSDWFVWIDAGICSLRDNPPPNKSIYDLPQLAKLPTTKLIYTESFPYIDEYVGLTNYYHHVSGTYMIHSSFINEFAEIYYAFLDTLTVHRNIWTDQVVFTHIFKKHPEMFYKLANGYGAVIPFLYM